ncbi:GNAT family N-acetyltransferase (plasmid) [Paenibacillus rhizovicinus]|uniref:GNAT family N-acetyltransferase n=1 Tax=Paenibacillus rhizovicinus TaxID=2704463 RepID=A0A6C0PAI4_9BACL|nr:GNAT family N-acetyltransferase [Paenibacillus rhizovicinus]QHW35557.1 GNAT family N-acetyltransferase [Paenibacillus rhizovicinus]
MYTIREITTPLTDSQKQEILSLVDANTDSVGTYVVEKNSPFYKYISMRENMRTSAYFDRLQKKDDHQTHIIVGENTIGNVIGYLLYIKDRTCADDVSICSTVVATDYRRQGVFTGMLNQLKSKCKGIGLSCSIELVGFYEKFEFQVDDQFETQVGMSWGGFGGKGEFWSVDDDDINHLPQVEFVLQIIQEELGQSFDRRLSRFNMDNVREKNKVAEFIRKYKNSHS